MSAVAVVAAIEVGHGVRCLRTLVRVKFRNDYCVYSGLRIAVGDGNTSFGRNFLDCSRIYTILLGSIALFASRSECSSWLEIRCSPL